MMVAVVTMADMEAMTEGTVVAMAEEATLGEAMEVGTLGEGTSDRVELERE